jgi:hypothetical protein
MTTNEHEERQGAAHFCKADVLFAGLVAVNTWLILSDGIPAHLTSTSVGGWAAQQPGQPRAGSCCEQRDRGSLVTPPVAFPFRG